VIKRMIKSLGKKCSYKRSWVEDCGEGSSVLASFKK